MLTIPVMVLPARRLRQAGAKAETCAASMSHLKQQWLWLYATGRATFPPLAATAALAYTYLSYLSDDELLARLYITAAVSTISIVPFTLLVMMPTNNLLAEAAAARGGASPRPAVKREGVLGEEEEVDKAVVTMKQASEVEDEEFLRLVVKWARLNYLRHLLPLAGAVIGLTAILK